MNQSIAVEEKDLPKQETGVFLKKLEEISDIEEKLRASISFMRDALAQNGTANFKGFWEVRKLCLPLFKEPLAGPVRAQLWADYIELTREGRRLKNLLDEETAFAVEQIDLAVVSLEKEVDAFHQDPEKALSEVPDFEFLKEPAALEERSSLYKHLQKQLNALNVYASRINSLRKELIRTEMRIRQKNQFFQRLSHLGDRVFPQRKDLIQQVSESFFEDVERFVSAHFSDENFSQEQARRSLFFFREEIKNLQATAKMLTLNTYTFSKTREQLSGCWDKLKGMERELKKEFANQKQKSSENTAQVQEKIKAFESDYVEGKYSIEEGCKELDAIAKWMREIELTRSDVLHLKDLLAKAREPLEAKQTEEEAARRQKQAAFEEARREKVEQFKQEIDSLSQKIVSEDVNTLLAQLEECRKTFSSISMLKVERQQIERKLKTIRDQIAEKQEQALLALSDDDRETLDNLKEILSQRKERRKEIKAQIEEYRKISGGSDLDFEKAMRTQELMNSEKELLSQIDESISQIEKKISRLKGSS
ncbi:MAG: hypothetical protein JJU12_00145 [Chlamydiales bacterium]|nr:hypothetical protein [Chlamydiales bacterium]